ncbi:HEAT repeat domain-containing protein, partial [bacterium]|nr:HEAT repeat domain-containing protein [bacterium]
AIGPATRAEVRAVVWGLRDGNPMVHEAAARAARAIDPNLPADARAELVAALSDHRGPVRAEVAAALGRVGGRAAVDPLIVRLSDSDERVRLSATHALGLLGADAITARDALKERLSDPDPKVREAAARAIARIDTAVR